VGVRHATGATFKVRPKGQKWVQVCDTGPFWQTSFLKAVDPERWPTPICTAEEYATLVEGKARRATAVLDHDMIRYNVTENRVLGALTAELNRAFASVGVNLRSGPVVRAGAGCTEMVRVTEGSHERRGL